MDRDESEKSSIALEDHYKKMILDLDSSMEVVERVLKIKETSSPFKSLEIRFEDLIRISNADLNLKHDSSFLDVLEELKPSLGRAFPFLNFFGLKTDSNALSFFCLRVLGIQVDPQKVYSASELSNVKINLAKCFHYFDYLPFLLRSFKCSLIVGKSSFGLDRNYTEAIKSIFQTNTFFVVRLANGGFSKISNWKIDLNLNNFKEICRDIFNRKILFPIYPRNQTFEKAFDFEQINTTSKTLRSVKLIESPKPITEILNSEVEEPKDSLPNVSEMSKRPPSKSSLEPLKLPKSSPGYWKKISSSIQDVFLSVINRFVRLFLGWKDFLFAYLVVIYRR